jgi:hypothetical protein
MPIPGLEIRLKKNGGGVNYLNINKDSASLNDRNNRKK